MLAVLKTAIFQRTNSLNANLNGVFKMCKKDEFLLVKMLFGDLFCWIHR